MSLTVVNDYFFKPDGNIEKGKRAAHKLVEYFVKDVPEVQLSLWLESSENPLHHYHITIFDNVEALERIRKSKAIEDFIEELFPEIDHSTYISPACDVWLADGRGVEKVEL